MSKKAVFLTVAIVLVLGASAFWANRQGYYVLHAKNYSVPATSMLPTLEVGDQFFASVFYPGFGETYAPVRGDIIVFKSKRGFDHVKRLIGLPGDTIQMRDGRIVLNGTPLPAVRTADYVKKSDDGTEEIFEKDRITLPNGRSYEVLNVAPDGALDNTREHLVPKGHCLSLGTIWTVRRTAGFWALSSIFPLRMSRALRGMFIIPARSANSSGVRLSRTLYRFPASSRRAAYPYRG